MLIGDLPQDVTPSIDGTVPYSEDGIHLNFIKIQDLLGLGGGGDGGGTGNFSEIEFPDGTKGYYIGSHPDVLEADSGYADKMGTPYANKAYWFTFAKIMRHPERYFSAYVKYGACFDNFYPTEFTRGLKSVPVILNDYSIENIDVGYKITSSGYADDYISSNFPYFLFSSKKNIVNPNHETDTDYYSVDESASVPPSIIEWSGDDTSKGDTWGRWYDRHQWEENIIDQRTGLPKHSLDGSEGDFTRVQLPDTTVTGPILHMLFAKGFADRIYDHYRYDPNAEHSDQPIGQIIIPTTLSVSEEDYSYVPSPYQDRDDYTTYPIPINHVSTWIVHGVAGDSLIVHLDPYSINLQQFHTNITYDVASHVNSDIYDDKLDGFNLKLWDTWSCGAFGVFCYHIIRWDDQEFWIYMDEDIERYDYVGDLIDERTGRLNAWIWDGRWICAHHGGGAFLNGVRVNTGSTPWAQAEIPGDLNPTDVYDPYGIYVKHFSSPSKAMQYVNAVVLGIDVDSPVASFMYSDNGGFGALVPTKRQLIYDWWLNSPSSPLDTISDYMYGVNDVLKESYICFSSLFGQHGSPAPIDSLDFLHGISFGNFYKIGYGIDDTSDLDNHIQEVGTSSSVVWADLQFLIRNSGGGSDLPVVDQSDEGKVLTVDSNGVWNDLYPEPFKLSGNIDSQTAIDVENYLSVRGGIRGDKVGGVASIYADPSVMHIGNYVDISSVKTGGFSIAKTEDANTGVTTMALDINDIDKFMQLIGGQGISITKALDANNVRNYTIEATPITPYLNAAFKNHRHIPDSTWVTLNTYADTTNHVYHPQPIAFDPGRMYYVDVTVSFDVPANIASGSYVKLILSPYGDEPTQGHSQSELATGVFGSTNGSGSETPNINRSSVLEDTRLLIPGVINTVRFAGMIAFGTMTLNTDLYLNIYQNSGVTLGYDAATPSSPAATLDIKTTGYYFKF